MAKHNPKNFTTQTECLSYKEKLVVNMETKHKRQSGFTSNQGKRFQTRKQKRK
jgi:hypothetical protein